MMKLFLILGALLAVANCQLMTGSFVEITNTVDLGIVNGLLAEVTKSNDQYADLKITKINSIHRQLVNGFNLKVNFDALNGSAVSTLIF